MTAGFSLELINSSANEIEFIHSLNKRFPKNHCLPGAALRSGVVFNFFSLRKKNRNRNVFKAYSSICVSGLGG